MSEPVQLTSLMQKNVSIHWEFMFTRSLFQTPDIQRQHEILEAGSRLIDRRHAAHDAGRESRPDQCGEPAPRPSDARARPHDRQAGARRIRLT
jgi:hypothetical protein